MTRRLLLLLSLLLAPWPVAGQETRNPHGPLRQECALCHRAEGWVPVSVHRSFDHAALGLALAGAHARTGCRGCHASLVFAEVERTCAGCHADVHRGELGTDCARCHTPRSFLDRAAMVRLHRETRFPLTGSHLSTDCEDCHTPSDQGSLTFVNRPTECVTCHGAAYAEAVEPDHDGLGFPRRCEECHATTVWPKARFTHSGTAFPLTGAHLTVACAGCHQNGVYRGTTAECAGCHQSDYDGTTDPVHGAAGFPTTCAECHSTRGWDGAAFNHDGSFFPIYSGAHRGKWSGCSTCHVDPSSFARFTCLTCHEHDQPRMDDKHRERAGYRYDSQACLSCHPRGDS
jgi:hypothetical protein